jgi:predicted RNase H-like HicB family nuclease
MRRYFTLEYWKDDGWFVGKLKEVPGVFSQGETLDELEANIKEVFSLMMAEDEESVSHSGVQMKELAVDV